MFVFFYGLRKTNKSLRKLFLHQNYRARPHLRNKIKHKII